MKFISQAHRPGIDALDVNPEIYKTLPLSQICNPLFIKSHSILGNAVRAGATTLGAVLSGVDDVAFSPKHIMFDVDLGALEPLAGTHNPPDQCTSHWSTVHKTCPVQE